MKQVDRESILYERRQKREENEKHKELLRNNNRKLDLAANKQSDD